MYIFKKVFDGYSLSFVEAEYTSTDSVISKLKDTEKKELALLIETGRSSVGSKL
jgi:hypothetical protein